MPQSHQKDELQSPVVLCGANMGRRMVFHLEQLSSVRVDLARKAWIDLLGEMWFLNLKEGFIDVKHHSELSIMHFWVEMGQRCLWPNGISCILHYDMYAGAKHLQKEMGSHLFIEKLKWWFKPAEKYLGKPSGRITMKNKRYWKKHPLLLSSPIIMLGEL